MFPDISGGAGGLSANSSAASRSGDASGSSGGNQFSFDFGGNPNATNNSYIYLSMAALVGVYIWSKRK